VRASKRLREISVHVIPQTAGKNSVSIHGIRH